MRYQSYVLMLAIALLTFNLNAQCVENCDGNQTIYGFKAGLNVTGSGNSFFGEDCGPHTTSGIDNSFFGSNAGFFNLTGLRNSFFGHNAGINNNLGKDNSFFGDNAGASNTKGEKNSYLGHAAGTNISTGIRNICIGFRSGPAIGNEGISDRLFIDVVKSDTPLIYGEFDNDHVVINGTFEVTAGISNNSSRQLKKDFSPVDAKDILDKVAGLTIDEWVYKHREDERHVGPIAEEFYELFGLGKDESQISTIDSDGIALLSIQALKAENDELRLLIQSLEEKVDKLVQD